jgi:hypothetical protein
MENPKKTQFFSTRTLKNGQTRLLEKTTLKTINIIPGARDDIYCKIIKLRKLRKIIKKNNNRSAIKDYYKKLE